MQCCCADYKRLLILQWGVSAICGAVWYGAHAAVIALLKAGADINVKATVRRAGNKAVGLTGIS